MSQIDLPALKQPYTMMPVKGMVAAVARGAQRNEVIRVIIDRAFFFKTAFKSRMVDVMHHKVGSFSTKLALIFISFKDSQALVGKPHLISGLVVNLFNSLNIALSSSLVFRCTIDLKSFSQILPPLFSASLVKFFSTQGDTGVAKLLSSRAWLVQRAANYTGLLSIVFHNIRVSFCGGLN